VRNITAVCGALALAFTAAVYAQDSTAKSETKVSVDDAHTSVMVGCLVRDAAGDITLMATSAKVGGDLKVTNERKTEVDGDDTKVKEKSEAKLEDAHDRTVGTTGTSTAYAVTARTGVSLESHLGERVEIAAVVVEPKKGGDDDAKVKIQDQTKVDRDDAPDSKAKTTTKIEVSRGSQPMLTAISIKTLSPTCQ
jgi:hypothetical protein